MTSLDLDTGARSSEPGAPDASGWTPRVVVSLISMCLLLDLVAAAYQLMAIALPSISARYETTQSAWLPTAFLLVGAVTSPLVGKLADMYGKRKFLIGCIVFAAAGAIIAANAPTFGILVAGCAVLGVLLPCMFLVYTLILDVFPKRTVSMSVSIVMSGMGLAAIPAPFLAGWLIGSFGSLGIFWFMFICLIVCVPLMRFTTAESSSRQHSQLDPVGAVLLGAGIAGVLLGISFAPQRGWVAPSTLACFLGGAGLLAAWVLSARWIKQPLIDLRLLKNRAVALIVLTTGLAMAVSTVFVIILPHMAMTSRSLGLGYGFGVDAIGFALILAPFGVGSLLGGVMVGWVVKHIGPRATMIAGMAIMAVGLVLTILSHRSEGLVIAFVAIVGLGTGCCYASSPNLILAFVPRSIHATVGAITSVAQAVLAATLPMIAFAVLNSHIAMEVQGRALYSNTGISLGFLVAAVGGALGILMALALPRRPGHAGLQEVAGGVNTAAAS